MQHHVPVHSARFFLRRRNRQTLGRPQDRTLADRQPAEAAPNQPETSPHDASQKPGLPGKFPSGVAGCCQHLPGRAVAHGQQPLGGELVAFPRALQLPFSLLQAPLQKADLVSLLASFSQLCRDQASPLGRALGLRLRSERCIPLLAGLVPRCLDLCTEGRKPCLCLGARLHGGFPLDAQRAFQVRDSAGPRLRGLLDSAELLLHFGQLRLQCLLAHGGVGQFGNDEAPFRHLDVNARLWQRGFSVGRNRQQVWRPYQALVHLECVIATALKGDRACRAAASQDHCRADHRPLQHVRHIGEVVRQQGQELGP